MKVCLVDVNMDTRNVVVGECEQELTDDFSRGIVYVAAWLRHHDWDTKLISIARWCLSGEVNIDQSFHARCAEKILQSNPGIIGFNTREDSFVDALNIAKQCKALSPHVRTVLGGPSATPTDIVILETFPFVDFVVRGEGELTMLELCKILRDAGDLSSVAGITYRDDNNLVKRNPDRPLIRNLDELPIVAYEPESIPNLDSSGNTTFSVDTGRGCPYKCVYCSTCLMWGNKSRLRSIDNLMSEITYLYNQRGARLFSFIHDHFTANRRFVKEFCNRMISEGLNSIIWACSSRVDAVNEEMLELMSQAGCRFIFFGVEAGSARMQEFIGKRLDVTRIADVLLACERNGICVTTSFIVGFPEATEEDVDATLSVMMDCAVAENSREVQLYPLVLHPGTEIMRLHADKLVMSGFLESYTLAQVRIPDNRELILKYPHIFSEYYSVDSELVPPLRQYELRIMFHHVLNYARSIRLAQLLSGLTPFKFAQEYIDACWKAGLTRGKNQSEGTANPLKWSEMVNTPAVIRGMKSAPQWIGRVENTLQFEEACQAYLRNAQSTDKLHRMSRNELDHSKIATTVPVVGKNTGWIRWPNDPDKEFAAVMNDGVCAKPKDEASVFLVCVDPYATSRTRRLWHHKCDDVDKAMLALIDGNRSVNDIAAEMQRQFPYIQEVELQSRCIEFFRLLMEKGVVESARHGTG